MLRKLKISSLILAFAFTPAAVWAAPVAGKIDPAEVRCKAFDDASISRMSDWIREVDKAVPNVPPEERKYLEDETARARKIADDEYPSSSKSNRIYTQLASRPLYSVWELRKAMDAALQDLGAVTSAEVNANGRLRTYWSNADAEKLEKATLAIESLSRFSATSLAFLESSQGRALITVDQKEYSGLISVSISLPGELARYASCKLAKIMGPQELPSLQQMVDKKYAH